jgi:hypothetical protein
MWRVRHEPPQSPSPPKSLRVPGREGANPGQVVEAGFWLEVMALASELLAHSPLQPADRDDVRQQAMVALLDALKCERCVACLEAWLRGALRRLACRVWRARIRGRITRQLEDGDALPGPDRSDEIEPLSLLAEMPEPLRTWYRQELGMDPPDAIAPDTVRWRRSRILRWIRSRFFSESRTNDSSRSGH